MSETLRAAMAAPLNRRALLAGLAAIPTGLLASQLMGGLGSARADTLDELVIYGPPAGPSIILAEALASGELNGLANKTSFKVWRSPDEMRAGLTSGTMSAVVLPVQVAANLYNRGMKLKLLNTMTDGLIYIVSDDTELNSIPALKGKRLAVPFRNDMPDLVFKRLLAHYGLAPEKDISLENTSSPIEAMQMLLTGKVDAVLAPEPAISAAIMLGKTAGKDISRTIDVQKLWGEVTGKAPTLPQAGLVLTDKLLIEHPDLADRLQSALEAASQRVNADAAKAASIAAQSLDFPEPVLAASIATSRLMATRASKARPAIETMLETLASNDPAIIAGKLPDDGFYL
ncbi:ABC transporter substrate-binding protein [Ochrobactrum sp. MYb379]|uniref:ABC transporter substrate-binding protein n=1 Tax=Ochrobactrum sp. MYb379 TaxID=2745275 RepID=UPI003096EE40